MTAEPAARALHFNESYRELTGLSAFVYVRGR